MRPSPKLPTSRSPPNFPNVGGASATSTGWFSGPIRPTRASNFPLRSKTSTYPPVGAVVAVGRGRRSVGDEDPPADRLDPELVVPGGDLAVDEGALPPDRAPVGIEDVDASVMEVGRVEVRGAVWRRSLGEPAIDGPPMRVVDRNLRGVGALGWERFRPSRGSSRPRTRR